MLDIRREPWVRNRWQEMRNFGCLDRRVTANMCSTWASAWCLISGNRIGRTLLIKVTECWENIIVYKFWCLYFFLRAERSGDRIPVRAKFSVHVQTGPEAHPMFCTMCTGSFLGVNQPERGAGHLLSSSAEVENGLELFHHLHSVPAPAYHGVTFTFAFHSVRTLSLQWGKNQKKSSFPYQPHLQSNQNRLIKIVLHYLPLPPKKIYVEYTQHPFRFSSSFVLRHREA